MNDSNHIEDVLQAMVSEMNYMNKQKAPALEHQLRALEAGLSWLNVSPLKGSYNDRTDNK